MRSFRLASVFGIEVRIDASWFILFFLLLWTFSEGVFPAAVEGVPRWGYWVLGLVTALLFFASLLAHELSHSLVARRRGVIVEGITLFIFGGMARTRMESRRPGDEFVIAGVGPLSSLCIALLFLGLGWLFDRLGFAPAAAVGYILAQINGTLAVFNLLPGFPLDGGRVLRSAVWKYTGSLSRATRIAARGGMIVAFGLIAWGAYDLVLGHEYVSGVWLVFVGLFLRSIVGTNARFAEATHALDEVPAREVMTVAPLVLPPDMSLADFLGQHYLAQPAYPVVTRDGRPLGVLTLPQALTVPEAERAHRTVGDVMTPASPALIVGRDESLRHVVERLSGGGPVLVTRDGRLEGMISAEDLARWSRRTAEARPA